MKSNGSLPSLSDLLNNTVSNEKACGNSSALPSLSDLLRATETDQSISNSCLGISGTNIEKGISIQQHDESFSNDLLLSNNMRDKGMLTIHPSDEVNCSQKEFASLESRNSSVLPSLTELKNSSGGLPSLAELKNSPGGLPSLAELKNSPGGFSSLADMRGLGRNTGFVDICSSRGLPSLSDIRNSPGGFPMLSDLSSPGGFSSLTDIKNSPGGFTSLSELSRDIKDIGTCLGKGNCEGGLEKDEICKSSSDSDPSIPTQNTYQNFSSPSILELHSSHKNNIEISNKSEQEDLQSVTQTKKGKKHSTQHSVVTSSSISHFTSQNSRSSLASTFQSQKPSKCGMVICSNLDSRNPKLEMLYCSLKQKNVILPKEVIFRENTWCANGVEAFSFSSSSPDDIVLEHQRKAFKRDTNSSDP